MRQKTEFKKIILACIALWCMVYVTVSGFTATNEGVAQAMIYAVMGAYLSYCAASASDKASMNRYGISSKKNKTEEDIKEGEAYEENEF